MVWLILHNARKVTWFHGPDKTNGADIEDERSATIDDQTVQMDNGIEGDNNGGGQEDKRQTGYNRDKPPEDDCCPICFGDFTVPCKTNCGHWFCGNCILQLWQYRSRPRQCRCPFCSCAIYKLVPEASAVDKMEVEVVKVLANIEKYNHLYADVVNCLFWVYLILMPVVVHLSFDTTLSTLFTLFHFAIVLLYAWVDW